jgi:gliding motility associated protien GldN
MNYYHQLLLLLSAALSLPLAAQVDYSEFIQEGAEGYKRVAVHERKIIELPVPREADAKFSRQIIRCIDTRQKMNKQLEWPKNPLSRLLFNGLSEGSIVAYKTDELSTKYTSTEIKLRGGYEQVVFISTDPTDPTIGYDTIIYVSLESSSIHKFWIKEEWVFDAAYSVFKPRIIAIAPIFAPQFGGLTIVATEQPLCWIKMDQIRQTLANSEMFNRYNDAARLSYDDFFQMRIFDSYIIYESNVFDLFISQFQEFENDGEAALLESDRIKNDLFIFEHDLWQF